MENILIRLDRKRKMPLTKQSGVMVFMNFLETCGKYGLLC